VAVRRPELTTSQERRQTSQVEMLRGSGNLGVAGAHSPIRRFHAPILLTRSPHSCVCRPWATTHLGTPPVAKSRRREAETLTNFGTEFRDPTGTSPGSATSTIRPPFWG
jgi:hypothetical protein